MQTAVRCMLARGATSKGAYFLAEDLPRDPAVRAPDDCDQPFRLIATRRSD